MWLDKLMLHEIVRLRIAGIKAKRIAFVMGINENTVKSVLSGINHSKETGITPQNRREFFGIRTNTKCLVCPAKTMRGGKFCSTHYKRKQKYGDPLKRRLHRNGTGPIIQEPIR